MKTTFPKSTENIKPLVLKYSQAEEIEKFRLIRCEADYDIDKPFRSQAEVKMLVERAKRVKEHI